MKKTIWTKEYLYKQIERFKKENKRIPQSNDFSECYYLPNPKTIARNFGGLQKLRKDMGEGVQKFNSGEYRRDVARKINKRNERGEGLIYKMLVKKHGQVLVHRNWGPYDDSKVNIDFLVFEKNGKKAIGLEIFYPKDKGSFWGCLNIKQNKYQLVKDLFLDEVKFYYVVMNPEIGQEDIDSWMSRKKIPLKGDGVWSYETLLGWVNGK